MAWSCHREFTEEDVERLQITARRFVAKYNIPERDCLDYGEPLWRGLDYLLDWERDKYEDLRRLWLGCLRRALRDKSATGVAYGYVGSNTD